MGDTNDVPVAVTVVTPSSPSPPPLPPPPPPHNRSIGTVESSGTAMNPTPKTTAPAPVSVTTPPTPEDDPVSPPEASSAPRARAPVSVLDAAAQDALLDSKYDDVDLTHVSADPTTSSADTTNRIDGNEDADTDRPYTAVGRWGKPVKPSTNNNNRRKQAPYNTNQARTKPTDVTMPHRPVNPAHISPISIPHRERYLDKPLLEKIPVMDEVKERQFAITFDLPFEKYKDIRLTNRWKTNTALLIRAMTGCPKQSEMHKIPVDQRHPICNALEDVSLAKVVAPNEDTLSKLLQNPKPPSVIPVRIVLYYYEKAKADVAKKAFTDVDGIRVLISHPSSYCGRAYNVPHDYDEERLRKYIQEATRSTSYANSFAFRRLTIGSTGLATTTFEWAALSDAADFVCNVQVPNHADGTPIGIEWRVARKGQRLPDILKTAGIPVHPDPPRSKPASPVRNSYASIVSAGLPRTRPIAAAGTPTLSPAPPASNAAQPTPLLLPADTTTNSALLQQMIQMQATQNEFNTKLLDRMNQMMKSSIDQFTTQMQMLCSVLTRVDGRLATTATQQSVDTLQQSVNALQQSFNTLAQSITGNTPPPLPPAATQPAPSTGRSRATSAPPRRRGRPRVQNVTPAAPPPVVMIADTAAAVTVHSSEPSPNNAVSPDTAASLSQLTYSLSTTSSITSDTTQVLIESPILQSLSSSDDTASDQESDEQCVSSTDTNNVTRQTPRDTDGSSDITLTVMPASNRSVSGKQLRDRGRTKHPQTQAEKQAEYKSTRPPNSSRSHSTMSTRKKDTDNL
jgi:hypothetical protein